MNRLLDLLDAGLAHIGRFLRRELEVPLYWKVMFVVQGVLQGALGAVALATGSIPWMNIAMMVAFGVLAVAFARPPTGDRGRYCRSCGRRLITRPIGSPAGSSVPETTWTRKVCPLATPTIYEMLMTSSPISCDSVERLYPLYHKPHDPYMPDIDCVPCLIEMELAGSIAGREVSKRIKRLLGA
jgi:hypothetical protein